MRNLFTSLKALSLGALALLAFGHTAEAANPLELNFGLFGPRYDGRVKPCEAALPTIIGKSVNHSTGHDTHFNTFVN